MSSNDKRVTVVVQRCDKVRRRRRCCCRSLPRLTLVTHTRSCFRSCASQPTTCVRLSCTYMAFCCLTCNARPQASLLLDNVDVWAHVGWGLVVYVSFAKGATDAAVSTAARKILHAPILTRGVWGDDNRPQSVAQFCRQHQEQHTGEALGGGGGGGGGGDVPTDEPIAEIPDASDGPDSIATLARQTAVVPNILVIPQAALTNKYTGKSIQYRNQSTRADGKRLFELFLAQLQEPLLVYVATIPSMLLRPVHLVNQALNQDADTTVQYMYSNFCWCRYPDDPALQKAKSRHNMGAFHKRKAGRDSDVHLLPSDYFREGTEFRDKFSRYERTNALLYNLLSTVRTYRYVRTVLEY